MGQLDSLAWACSTLAKARAHCSLINLKLEEAGEGMYCSSQSLGIVGGGANPPWVCGGAEVAGRMPPPATNPYEGHWTH